MATSPSFLDLIKLADSIRRTHYRDAGISTTTPSDELHGVTSGQDVVLKIFQGAGLDFQGLTKDAAREVCEYFIATSKVYPQRSEISIWYRSWAVNVCAGRRFGFG